MAEAPQDETGACRTLWLSVIEQAVLDLFETPDRQLALSKGQGPDFISELARRERREAERFLLDTKGPWAKHRALVCALAGVDPDKLREEVWQRFDEATRP